MHRKTIYRELNNSMAINKEYITILNNENSSMLFGTSGGGGYSV